MLFVPRAFCIVVLYLGFGIISLGSGYYYVYIEDVCYVYLGGHDRFIYLFFIDRSRFVSSLVFSLICFLHGWEKTKKKQKTDNRI